MELGKIATKVILENDQIKVWDLTLDPGEATDWHQHEMDYLFVVIDNCKVCTEYIDGSIEQQDDVIGKVDYRKKDKIHRLKNLDNKQYRNIVIEFKSTIS